MRKAAIDIGSNSVRLMVADVAGDGFAPVIKKIDTTRLHEGLDERNILSAESMARTAAAICTFAREARQAGVRGGDIFAYATSAVRDARNGDELIGAVKRDCGVDIRLLSGDEEARYAFYAAARPGSCGVIDIGGASTEMICGDNLAVRAAYSAQMGAVRLRRQLGDGAAPGDMLGRSAAVLSEGIAALGELPRTFVGVAGTITTLYALSIALDRYDPDRIQGGYLSRADAELWFNRLCPMSIDERRALPGMPVRRAEIIDFGAAILVSFMRLAGLEGIYVSDRDNLYSGIMLGGGGQSGALATV